MLTLFVFISLGLLFGYYFVYGRRLERHVVRPTDVPTCAHRLRDGVDYYPAANKYVLFGHHLASIAGLGPIAGPALAIVWGWLPALIWIWAANLFVGLVLDYLALMSSVRYDGRSIQWIIGKLTSPIRVSYPFQVFIYLLFITIAAGFTALTIGLWQAFPSAGTMALRL